MESIILDKLIVNKNRVDYYFRVSKGIQKYFEFDRFFVEYEVDISDIPHSILVIPFVGNVLPLTWLTGCDLMVRDIDRTFYDAISMIKNAYQEMYPNFKFRGTVVPAKTTVNTYIPEREAMLLFSGGIDANASFIRIREKQPILVNIQGLYGRDISENAVYDADKRDISAFATKNDVQSEFVRSNFMKFVNIKLIDKIYSKALGDSWWHGLHHSFAFISITIPLAVKYKTKSIYIASSNHIYLRIPCASDPTTDIQFKFAKTGGVVHDGFELTRQNKTKIIVDYQKQHDIDYPIRVCSFNDKNCDICYKCFRTIVAILAEGGKLKRFDFNIEGKLDEYFNKYMSENIRFIPVKTELSLYLQDSKERVIENIDYVDKDFANWLLNYDFIGNHRRAIIKYRITNFFPIIKRKIKNMIK